MSKFFSGTFDGNGHTINANIEEHYEDYVALFSTINGATIKNLTVAGTITGEGYTAGVVGYSMGPGNKNEKCIVTARINGDSISFPFPPKKKTALLNQQGVEHISVR